MPANGDGTGASAVACGLGVDELPLPPSQAKARASSTSTAKPSMGRCLRILPRDSRINCRDTSSIGGLAQGIARSCVPGRGVNGRLQEASIQFGGTFVDRLRKAGVIWSGRASSGPTRPARRVKMEKDLYGLYHKEEGSWWWGVGRRTLVGSLLRRYGGGNGRPHLREIGCGAGGLLTELPPTP